MTTAIYGYAKVSKTVDATANLETQLHILQGVVFRAEIIFANEMTGSSISRPMWNEVYPSIDGSINYAHPP